MSSQFEDVTGGSEFGGESSTAGGAGGGGNGLMDDGSNGSNTKKRKRNRQALNCNMCRARKVQCDRRRPACTACIKRGTGAMCEWDDNKAGDLPAQTFALEAVVDR